ncbi:hypothetical protein RRG08_028686 [Elysia crispata]|uniref:Uncharacterized protein n=1 Tax=Elysia crispata TaxID=231223 RepID=A0AAE1B263_9GAST|nr:hypothetical protein RRG08_028686 [Elysia crispata]
MEENACSLTDMDFFGDGGGLDPVDTVIGTFCCAGMAKLHLEVYSKPRSRGNCVNRFKNPMKCLQDKEFSGPGWRGLCISDSIDVCPNLCVNGFFPIRMFFNIYRMRREGYLTCRDDWCNSSCGRREERYVRLHFPDYKQHKNPPLSPGMCYLHGYLSCEGPLVLIALTCCLHAQSAIIKVSREFLIGASGSSDGFRREKFDTTSGISDQFHRVIFNHMDLNTKQNGLLEWTSTALPNRLFTSGFPRSLRSGLNQGSSRM